MSESVKVALIIALPPTLAALLSWWNTRKRLVDIHQVVNSRLDAALERIEQQVREIRELKTAIADLRAGR